MGDEPAQGRAMVAPIVATQPVSLGPADAELVHDEPGHPRIDLVE